MKSIAVSSAKRPIHLTINADLVTQAKAYTDNLSATLESLLAEYVARQEGAQRERQRLADACASDWNAVNISVGSFADELCCRAALQPWVRG